MSLVRWFRKNRNKVMAIVVIVILFGFIGGGTLLERLGRRRTATKAYFGDGKKITTYDLALASQELEILRMLGAGDLLRSQDLRGIVLAELLFTEGRAPAVVLNRIRQIIRANRYRVSDKQISDIYRRSMPSDIYWLLLKKEAQLAGIRIVDSDAREVLGRAIPQLFNGQKYSQRLGLIIGRYGVPEAEILATFGKLLAVIQYAQLMCLTENVTNSQTRHAASWENETIDVEFVKFDSAVFARTQEQPSAERMLEHFDRYKKFFAGQVSGENPCGFGYKLPDRVQVEYIALKLDDVSATVAPPTHQETEQYYQRHTEQFTESVPEDPNDPNSPLVERTRTYGEVASSISKQLLKDKMNSKAEKILQEAKTLSEAGLQDLAIEPEDLTAELLKQKAGDYATIASELSKTHKIKIYMGQTGLLGAVDMEEDEYFRRLYVTSHEGNPVRLTQLVFSIDELQTSPSAGELLLGVSKPKIYENIGPVRDLWGEIMAVVRVIKAEEASEAENINQSFSKCTLELESERQQPGEPATPDKGGNEAAADAQHIFSVKEKVAEDLKKLAAMDTAKGKAEEFINMVAKDGWENTINKFNELYRSEAKQDEDDPNVFKLEKLTGLQRISSKTLAALAAQSEGNPGQRLFVQEVQKWLYLNEATIESQFMDKLYSLVPADSNTVDDLPVVMEFEPNISFCVIKDISIKRLEQQQYESIKARQLFVEDYIQSQSLAPVHFNPENILKRMNFRLAPKRGKTVESEGAS